MFVCSFLLLRRRRRRRRSTPEPVGATQRNPIECKPAGSARPSWAPLDGRYERGLISRRLDGARVRVRVRAEGQRLAELARASSPIVSGGAGAQAHAQWPSDANSIPCGRPMEVSGAKSAGRLARLIAQWMSISQLIGLEERESCASSESSSLLFARSPH